jgi:hypothetical protein
VQWDVVEELQAHHLPESVSTNWPYYMDNTVFGEDYAQMQDIPRQRRVRTEGQAPRVEDTDQPKRGVAGGGGFHVLCRSNKILQGAGACTRITTRATSVNAIDGTA